MNGFAISSIITAVASLFLAVFILLRNAKNPLNQGWFLVSMLMGLWSLGLWGVVTAHTEVLALKSQNLLDLSAIFIPFAYFFFTVRLLQIEDKYKKLERIIFLGCVFLAFFSFTSAFKLGVTADGAYGFNYWVKPGKFYLIFPVYFSSILFGSFWLLISNFNKLNLIHRQQVRYVIISGLIGYIGGVTNFFPQFIHSYPFGNYFIILYIAAVAYAIVKHRLMGIRLLASKIFFYVLVAGFTYVYFHLVTLIDIKYLGGIYSSLALVAGVGFSVLFALIFLPVLNRVQKSSDALFFKGNNPREILKDLSIQLSSSIELDSLLVTLGSIFKRVLASEDIDVFLFKKIKDRRIVCSSILNEGSECLKLSGAICTSIERDKHPILVRDELDRQGKSSIVDEMKQLEAKVAAPLLLRGKVIGIIFLGEKMDGDAYTKEDIEFLEIISSQAAVAIENARLYDEISEFNETLQSKVDAQTTDIKTKAEHLEKLMKMRSEFLDITSHQLRTPVSVIKGVLSMLEEGSIPPARVKEFISGAMEKSIKLGETISDILRASEMDSDKFLITVRPTDISDMLEKLKEDKRRTAEMKKLVMNYNFPKVIPLVMTDPKYAEHAIINLLNNALQYTVDGSITTSVEVTTTHVILRVADTGIGIPPEAKEKMFTKFGRAANAVTTFTDGTGLGLYIIKEIVDANPGAKIEIEKTEVGKGTTFALWFPIATPEDVAKAKK